MALSFHYSGKFANNASLPELIGEVKDIAVIHQWEYHIFKEQFPPGSLKKEIHDQEIYGICFSPPECEPVWICFLSNGRMSSPPNLEYFSSSSDPEDRTHLYTLSVKTQFAGIEVHIKIIRLLQYLNTKYLVDLQVSDEGQFWETGDEHLLKQIFERYDQAMRAVTTGMENNSMIPGETYEEFFMRILKKRTGNEGQTS